MINQKIKVEVFRNPIRHWVIRNFLLGPEQIIREIKSLSLNSKDSDQCQFSFGETLKDTDNRILREFYEEFSSEGFIANIGTITGTKLTGVDIVPFVFSDTDYLLPGGNNAGNKKIAFVLFLNSLQKTDGGSLDFFKDSLVHQRIPPERGMLVLFEISPKSLHQISEVIRKEMVLLTGWFYG